MCCQQHGKLEFDGLTGAVSNFLSLRASAHTGVAIPRIDVPPLVEEFQKTAQKNGLYDDRMPEIRRRFPHQSADWFGMTVLFGARAHLCKFQFPGLWENPAGGGNWFTIIAKKGKYRRKSL